MMKIDCVGCEWNLLDNKITLTVNQGKTSFSPGELQLNLNWLLGEMCLIIKLHVKQFTFI